MSLPALSPWSWAMLIVLMTLASWQDLVHRRIPNRLLLWAACSGALIALVPGGTGLTSALGGGIAAGAAFSPLYLMRQLGGGDLKLMTTAGLLVGMTHVVALCLSVAMAGGLLALVWVWRSRHFRTLQAAPFNRMPYAVAIALGTATHSLLELPWPMAQG